MPPFQDKKIARIAFRIFLALVAGVSLTGWYIFAMDSAFYLHHLIFILGVPVAIFGMIFLITYLPFSPRRKGVTQIVFIILMILITFVATLGWYLLATTRGNID